MSKKFTTLKHNKTTNRDRNLEILIKDNLEKILEDNNLYNVPYTFTFNKSVDYEECWNLVVDQLSEVIQYILYCIEMHNNGKYPRIETILGITKNNIIDIEDVISRTLVGTSPSKCDNKSKKPNILKSTEYGKILFVLKNCRFSLTYDLIGYPCGLLSKNNGIYNFFKIVDRETPKIFIDFVSNLPDNNSRISNRVLRSIDSIITPNIKTTTAVKMSKTSTKDNGISQLLTEIESIMREHNLFIYSNRVYCLIEGSVCSYKLWRGKNGLSKKPGS